MPIYLRNHHRLWSSLRLGLHALLTTGAILVLIHGKLNAQVRDQPLTGVRKVTVRISYNPEADLSARLSEDRLRTVLEIKLRQAGLRVLSAEEDRQNPSLSPFVHLAVMVSHLATADDRPIGFAYTLVLSANVLTRVPFNSASAPQELWSHTALGHNSEEDAPPHIERLLGQLADSFLNEWLAANPRQ